MPISSPLVSVIALCYNQDDFLVDTLDSIKLQTYKNIELIIIDDCSTDQSVKKIESWIKANKHNCKFIKNKENLGLVKSLNIAVKQLKGKYYSLIACDDIYLPKKTENQVKIFEELDDSFGAIYSDSYLIDENGLYNYGTQIARKLIEKPPSGNIYKDLLKKDNFVPALSVIYKTEVVKDLSYYDDNLIYEDYDMLLRLSKKFKVAFSKSIDACYRLHQTNMNYNLNKPKFLDSKIKILFKHLNKENSNLEIGTLLKEKILNLCEQLYMQKSNLTHVHLKKLRDDHNYGKIIYFCNYIGFSYKVYFIMRIILLNRKHILTLNIR